MSPTKPPRKRPAPKSAVAVTPHPSGGNGYVYSHDFRLFTNYIRDNGLEDNPIIFN